MRTLPFFLAATLAVLAARADPPPPAIPVARPVAPSPAEPANPVKERAQALSEAAGLLVKAEDARARGNRSFAEQLFSSAELIVGPEALAELGPRFREGAPPRVQTPLKTLPKDTQAQPAVVGNSDEEHPEPRPERGSLAGSVVLDGGAGEGLSVVTLEPASGKWKRRAPRVRTMEQRDRQFAPRVLAVPVGSTVSFPNFDPIFHNVFSLSDTKPFDLGIYKNGQAREVTFEREGLIHLGCNLHANMSADILVIGAPHYAITDGKGRFSFKSLAPGKYLLKVWSDKSSQPASQPITIEPKPNTITVKLKADAQGGLSRDKFGAPRGKSP